MKTLFRDRLRWKFAQTAGGKALVKQAHSQQLGEADAAQHLKNTLWLAFAGTKLAL